MDAPLPPAQKPPVALNPVLLWVSGSALVLFIIGVFTLFLLMTRTEPLAQRLVREARAFEGDDWPRPSHFSPPVKGRFADAITPLLPELEELPEVVLSELASPDDDSESDEELEAHSVADEALMTQCLAVSRGEAPLQTVPYECLETLRQNRELLHRALATTRAEVGGLPESLSSLARFAGVYDPSDYSLLEHMATMAALETRVLRAEGRTYEAVDTCMDGLALSREASLGGGLYGLHVSARCHDILYLPCTEALAGAPVERLREAREQLARLRQGYPLLSAVLREESVYQQLTTYGDMLTPQAIDALPPLAQELVSAEDRSYYYEPPEQYPRLRPYAWRRNAALFEEMAAVADLPAEQRRKAFDFIDARQGLMPEDQAWHTQNFSDSLEALQPQRLQALGLAALVEVELARAELGTWPETLPPPFSDSFALIAYTDMEAWLVPLDEQQAALELHFAVDPSLVPRSRQAGGALR
jgi:hypothetical protein